ncbi:MAG TPA: peptidase E [Bacteroidales bacterium]|jgi:peptidase E|nr:peptidase E [Bacteroidales bacterium]
MKNLKNILTGIYLLSLFSVCSGQNTVPTVFATGGELNETYLRYIIELTKKADPKICFMPTAGADNPYAINWWYELCQKLPVKTVVLKTFINSSPEQSTFAETILSSDAVVVGGGNTLNMIAIWKAQGIDTVLMKAYKKGIIMAGGSAGSLCWFKMGITDSRPQKLTIVDCLGFIAASHCPHFTSEASRRPLYEKLILENKILPGYALDDKAAVLFKNGKFLKAVSLDNANSAWYISVKNGKLDEKKLETEIIR